LSGTVFITSWEARVGKLTAYQINYVKINSYANCCRICIADIFVFERN
jgi:hypothetical protein